MNRIIYYDIDETLFTFDEEYSPKITILNEHGNVVDRVDNVAYNQYKLPNNHTCNFEEFRCSDKFLNGARPILNMIRLLRKQFNAGNKVELLTARADMNDKTKIAATFLNYGINITPTDDGKYVHLRRAGNFGHDSPSKNKYEHITRAIQDNFYDDVVMYDDNYKMLDVMKKISGEHGIHTTFHHVKKGKYKTYKFYDGEYVK